MYEKLVKRLREAAGPAIDYPDTLYDDAADAIEERNRKIESLEAEREISPEAEYTIDKYADNLISDMEELIKGLKCEPRWIPVTERLPECE